MRNRVETRIDAPPEAVWRVLSDFERYPEWNPFTPQVIGRCAPGADVRVLVKIGGDPFWMPRRVTKAEPNRCFEWVGRAWYSWMAPGQRAVTLEPGSDGGTLVVDDEYVGGVGGLMSKTMRDNLRQRMVEFGLGLKAAAEHQRA